MNEGRGAQVNRPALFKRGRRRGRDDRGGSPRLGVGARTSESKRARSPVQRVRKAVPPMRI